MINWILQNTALFIAIIVGVALWVSLVTESVKEYISVDSKLLCLIIGLVGTLVMYFCGSAYLGLQFLWFEAIPLILCSVFVSYIAMNGYNSLVKRYKDLMGDDYEEEDEDEEEDM